MIITIGLLGFTDKFVIWCRYWGNGGTFGGARKWNLTEQP